MGLVTPSYENIEDIKLTAVTLEERDFDIDTARGMGCIILHGADNRILTKNSDHIAIYPETGDITVWRDALVEVESHKQSQGDDLAPTAQVYGTARIDNLIYRGVLRRELRNLGRSAHRYSRAEDIRRGDRVRMSAPDGTTFLSYRINEID